MDDSRLLMLWAMNSPQHDDYGQATFPSLQPLTEATTSASETAVQELLISGAHAAANSWSFRNTTHGTHISAAETMDHDFRPPPSSANSACWHAATSGASLPASWNFSAVVSAEPASSDGTLETAATTTTQGLPKLAYGSLTPPPMRRAGLKSAGSTSTPPLTSYAQGHIIAERKRRKKINQLFVELSAVIPGLKRMDKATILSDATRHVKELQEKLNAGRGAGSGVAIRSSGTVVLVKKTCYAAPDKESSPLGAPAAAVTKPLPEIEAHFAGSNVMVRLLCENAKGVVARVLAEVEDLHLSIVDANVIPSPACTLNITITAKVDAAFIVTEEEIIGRVSSALYHASKLNNIAAPCSA